MNKTRDGIIVFVDVDIALIRCCIHVVGRIKFDVDLYVLPTIRRNFDACHHRYEMNNRKLKKRRIITNEIVPSIIQI